MSGHLLFFESQHTKSALHRHSVTQFSTQLEHQHHLPARSTRTRRPPCTPRPGPHHARASSSQARSEIVRTLQMLHHHRASANSRTASAAITRTTTCAPRPSRSESASPRCNSETSSRSTRRTTRRLRRASSECASDGGVSERRSRQGRGLTLEELIEMDQEAMDDEAESSEMTDGKADDKAAARRARTA